MTIAIVAHPNITPITIPAIAPPFILVIVWIAPHPALDFIAPIL